MRKETSALATTIAASTPPAVALDSPSDRASASAPRSEVLPTFEAIAKPPALPLSSGRVVVAMSALFAAWPVVAVACERVRSMV